MVVNSTFMAAARTVLEDVKTPLTTRELFDEIMRRKLVTVHGKTPYATLVAQLYKQARNDDADIIRVADEGQRRARRGTVRWHLRTTRRVDGARAVSRHSSDSGHH